MFSRPATDLGGILTALDGLAGHPFADEPVAALHQQVGAWCQAMARLQAVGAGLLAAWDAQAGWVDDGARSGAAWLRSYGEIGGPARRLQTARRLRQLPVTSAALAEGALSYTKAEILAGAVDDDLLDAYRDCEQVLVDTAKAVSVSQVTTLARRWKAAALDTLDDTDRAQRQRDTRTLRIFETLDGMLHIEGDLDPENGAIVRALLGAREQALFRDDINQARATQDLPPLGDGDDVVTGGLPLERTPGQRRADALVDLLQRGVDRDIDDERVGGPSSELHLTLGLDTLLTAGVERTRRMLAVPGIEATTISFVAQPLLDRLTAHGNCRASADISRAVERALHPGAVCDDHDHPVDGTLVDLLACDTRITRIICDAAGIPIDVGRTHRLATRAQRRALRNRDGGCAFPGCERPPAWCDAHHIIPWTIGGPTDIDNLVLLCRRHHSMMHTNQPWVVHIEPTTRQPVFTRPDGTPARPPGLVGLATPRGRSPDPPPADPPDPPALDDAA